MKNHNISKKHSQQIENTINKIDVFFKNIASQIQLNNFWEKKNLIEIEAIYDPLKGTLNFTYTSEQGNHSVGRVRFA